MSVDAIEQKLAELERRLDAVEAKPPKQLPGGNWRELLGWAKEDDLHREAARLGAEWRAKMNEEGR